MPLYTTIIESVRGQSKNLKNGFLYFAPSILAMLGAMFTMPIYSKYLSADDFGLLAYFTSIGQLFLPIASFGITSFFYYKYFRVDPLSQRRIFIDLFRILTAVNLFMLPLAVLVTLYFFNVFSVSYPVLPYIVIVLVNLLFDSYYNLFLVDFRLKKQGMNYFVLSGGTTLFSIVFGLFFVAILNLGPTGKLIGPLLARIMITVALIARIMLNSRKPIKSLFHISLVDLKELFKFVIPVILASYAYYPIQNIDKIYLERLKNPTEFGLYAIGLTFSGILGTLTVAIFQAFEPDLYRFYVEKQKAKYIKLGSIYLLMTSVLITGFILFSGFIVGLLTGGRFLGAVVYANINVFSLIFLRAGAFIEIIFVAKAKTYLLLYKNIILGVLSIIVFKIMIDSYGFRGGNYARVITSIMYPIVCYILIRFGSRSRKSEISIHE